VLKVPLLINFLLEPTRPSFPLFGLPVFVIKRCPELLSFKLPILKLFQLLAKFELFLPEITVLVILFPQEFVQPQQLLVEQCKFVLIVTDEILVVPEFHDYDFLFLAFLPQLLNVSIPVIQKLPAFSDLVLQTRPFVLEADGHLSDLPVNHRFPLTFHHGPEIIQLLDFALFSGLIPILPLFNF